MNWGTNMDYVVNSTYKRDVQDGTRKMEAPPIGP